MRFPLVAGRRDDRWPLSLCVVGFAVAYSLVSVFRHRHFDSGYDLAIFDQAIWHLSRFEAPASTVRGFTNLFGDHFHPLIAVIAPLYWILPRVETLLVVQSMLLAASIVPVFAFLRRRLSARQSLLLCMTYGCFWGLQRTVLSDFHELAFAPLLIATAVLAIDQHRWRLLWVASAALVLVKEDMIPLVGSFGAYLIYIGEKQQGRRLIAVSVVGFVVVVKLLIPWVSGSWMYGDAFAGVINRPWTAPLVLVTPPAKLMTVVFWLAPFLFLPLFSPLVWLLLPVVCERLLSNVATHWGYGAHYSAPLAPILVMAAGDALARTASRIAGDAQRTRLVTSLIAMSLVASMLIPGHQPLLRLLLPAHYRAISSQSAATAALALIPANASVIAQTAIAPHLSHRAEIYGLRADAPDAEFLVASDRLSAWPLETFDEVLALMNERTTRGYTTLFAEDGWVVLKRPVRFTRVSPTSPR